VRIRDIELAKRDEDCIIFEMVDSVFVNVIAEEGLYRWLSEQFKFRHPNWKAMQKKMPGWQGFVRFLKQDGLFPIGLIQRACECIDSAGYNWYFEPVKGVLYDSAATPERVETMASRILDNSGMELRDYQLEALTAIFTNKRCVIESGVGSGKSLVIYLIVRAMLMQGIRTLIVVPNTGLVNQLFSNFVDDYDWTDCGDYCNVVYSGVRYDAEAPILISTWQSLVNKDGRFFKDFGCVIIDEAHGAKAESLISVSEMCVNANYRIGTTGTLPDEPLDLMRIEGHLGRVVFNLSAGELVKRGVLSKFKINSLLIHNEHEPFETYEEEMNYVETLAWRNAVALNVIRKKTQPTDNVVLLFKKREHLETMLESCKNEFPDRIVYAIHGDIAPLERERIRQEMIAKGGHVLCATYQTMSEGINIPRLDHIIFCSPYRAKIKVMQSLGRVLRKHVDKAMAYLWDMVDVFAGAKNDSFTWKHYKKRLQYYKDNEFEVEEFNVGLPPQSVKNKFVR
jgi:superfamily II DNA or RNA helicase